MEAKVSARLYEGTPTEILFKMAKEMSDLLYSAGVPVSGLGALAMIHLAACAVRVENTDADSNLKMPTFKSMLTVMAHSYSGTMMSEEEQRAFDKDFTDIIISMGGSKMGKESVSIMSPSLGVH